ncbi:MAG: RNA polymerase sigma factor [Planctomycetaceae bacterium]|nr:RNA polymerase sigma factor [Planctomycetaceae bacterium]
MINQTHPNTATSSQLPAKAAKASPPAETTKESSLSNRPESFTDAELLAEFLRQRNEDTFRRIVQRYGTMVYAVSLRIVRDHQMAEDVVQATFLVLASQARKIRRRQSLSSWLHGTALRIGKKALRRRHRLKETPLPLEIPKQSDPIEEIGHAFEQQVLDEELQRLPSHYRDAILLHYFEGQTYEQTATTLGVTVGTIEGRIKRGKRELQIRLARRGVGIGIVFTLVSSSCEIAQAALSSELTTTIVQNGIAMTQGTPFTPTCSSEAAWLAGKEAMMLTSTKLVLAGCALALAVTTGWVGQSLWAGDGDGLASREDPHLIGTEVQQASPEGLVQFDSDSNNQQPDRFSRIRKELKNAFPQTKTNIVLLDNGPTDADIHKANETLNRIVTVEFSNAPLREALQHISKQYQLNIVLVEDDIPDVANIEIDASVSEETLGTALKQMLHEHDLDFYQARDVLVVTTKERARVINQSKAEWSPELQALSPEQRRKLSEGASAADLLRLAAEKRGDVSVRVGETAETSKIYDAFSQRTSFEFPGNPLRDVIDFVSQQHAINIVFDLANTDIDPETLEVELVLSGVSFRSAMNLLLGTYDLGYIVRDEVLVITTKEKAEKFLETRIYNLRLVNPEKDWDEDGETLAELITQTTGQSAWDGKTHTATYFDGNIVVRQTEAVHKEISDLLKSMQTSRE